MTRSTRRAWAGAYGAWCVADSLGGHHTLVQRPFGLLIFCPSATEFALGGVRVYLRVRDPSPGAELLISAHLGEGEGLRPTLLGTLEAHLGASDPLRGGRV